MSIIAKIFYYLLSVLPFILFGYYPFIYSYFGLAYLLILSVIVFGSEIFIFDIFFKLIYKKLNKITIRIESVSVNDESFIGTFLSYLIPLSVFFIEKMKNNNILLICTMVVSGCLILSVLRNVIISPFLLFFQYHCYKINIVNGVGGCVLITKRTITSPKDVLYVIQIFPYFYIE